MYKDLKSNSNIKTVEEDKILKICSDPDDTDYKEQWYVPNTNFNKLWSSDITSKSDAEVAVVDSGIDYNHEDLQGVIADGGYDFYDDNGHRTEVSGIIAANYNNRKGIAGLDSNFPIKILPLKTADQDGYTLLSDMIRAIDYAIGKKVSVINLSMGSNDYSEIENDEIQKAISSGIVIVAAAGNDGNSSYIYPASYDNVISVGATNINNTSSLSASINPDNAIDKKIIWSSSNNSIASVDQNGTAIITAKTGSGNLSSSITINVNDPSMLSIGYQAHVQNIGWQDWVYDGDMAGTTGQSLRVEAIKIKIIKK